MFDYPNTKEVYSRRPTDLLRFMPYWIVKSVPRRILVVNKSEFINGYLEMAFKSDKKTYMICI